MDLDAPLTRTAASDAVEAIGWRLLVNSLATTVTVASLDEALDVAQRATVACGDHAAGLRLDLRADRVDLSLQHRPTAKVTARVVELARAISTAVDGRTEAADRGRPVQFVELAIDTMDAASIRPFWKAVLAYVDEPTDDEVPNALIDPVGQLPGIWFQQMDEPRTDRNRIHFDVTVAHDEAEARVNAAIDAGGVLVSGAAARSFWILADVEGNEVCVCTWQDRDEGETS